MLVQQQFQQHLRRRARSPTRRQTQNGIGDTLSRQRMRRIHDNARQWINATPKGEAHIRDEKSMMLMLMGRWRRRAIGGGGDAL